MTRLDVEALYVALDRERRRRRISGREVLRQAGVPGPSIWTRLSQGGAPSADNLVRLLVWLDTTDLAPYITDTAPTGGDASIHNQYPQAEEKP